MIAKICKYLLHPSLFLIWIDRHTFIKIRDKVYIKILFKYFLKHDLDLNNPKSFNEKLQWLKLNDKKEIYTKMVDKYEVKEYVSNIIGSDYLIPTIGIYDKWDDINFDSLPDQFVIKCTHDSGSVVICKNKNNFDYSKAKKIINKSLKNNYFYAGREWPYKNVKPRIIIEQYMIDNVTSELRDYKFFCFNGNVKIFKIDFNRFTHHQANYYDTDKNLLPFGECIIPPDYNKKIDMPECLDQMIQLANKLSSNIPFVRVDFYSINNKIYFGEITFYPGGGFDRYTDDNWDYKMGSWIELPKK